MTVRDEADRMLAELEAIHGPLLASQRGYWLRIVEGRIPAHPAHELRAILVRAWPKFAVRNIVEATEEGGTA